VYEVTKGYIIQISVEIDENKVEIPGRINSSDGAF
jgi:hypothetical protein